MFRANGVGCRGVLGTARKLALGATVVLARWNQPNGAMCNYRLGSADVGAFGGRTKTKRSVKDGIPTRSMGTRQSRGGAFDTNPKRQRGAPVIVRRPALAGTGSRGILRSVYRLE